MNNIRIALNMRGMTAAELADRAGVAPPRISEWERGARIPGADAAAKLSSVLDVDEAWIRGTAQSAPLYDPFGKVTFACPIIRTEELPGGAGVLYHVYLPEGGDVVALLMRDGTQFTPTDWESWPAQPGNAAEIADCRWMDARGMDAVMMGGLPYMFPV